MIMFDLCKHVRIKAKKAMTGEIGEKPACVKTHVRNVVIIPEMVGSVVGIYNGKGIYLKCTMVFE